MLHWLFIWKEVRVPLFILTMTLFGGASGYLFFFPEESWLKSFYATAITLSTVGFGDILGVEQSVGAQIYTVILIFLGMGVVLYSTSLITAFLLEGRLSEHFVKQSILRKAGGMNQHFVVCGLGETGYHVLKEIQDSGKQVVVVEASEDKFHELRKEFPDLAVIVGDATSDEVLAEANIENAAVLVATLGNDKDNLFLTFTARMLSPGLKIVSKVVDVCMEKKIKNAGADYVVSPYSIGGMRMASVALRPNVVSFLDRMLRGNQSVRVGEFVVPEGSELVGKTLHSADIYSRVGVNVVAFSPEHNSEQFVYNPSPETEMKAGSVLLFVCNSEQQHQLEQAFS